MVEYKSILDQIIHPFTVVPCLAWQLVQLWNATYDYIHNPYIFSTAQMDFRKEEIEQATLQKQNSNYFHIGVMVVSECKTQVKNSHLLLCILGNVRQVT